MIHFGKAFQTILKGDDYIIPVTELDNPDQTEPLIPEHTEPPVPEESEPLCSRIIRTEIPA